MAIIDPLDAYDVDGEVDAFQDAILAELRGALQRTAKLLDPREPIQSSGRLRTFWSSKVDGLVTRLEAVVDGAATHTRELLSTAMTDALTAALDDNDPFAIPPPAELLAEIYLKSRQKFIEDIGTDTWGDVRETLVEGMTAGEGVDKLRDRVTAVTEFERSRAARIARTEVIGAVNAGAIGQIRASGLPATKTWIATNDQRTRATHAAVDGETIDLADSFMVGGWPMDRPHDPSAPAEEIIQCRCSLSFEIQDDELVPARAAALVTRPRLSLKFNPTQKRDYHGRFGEGSGVTASKKEFDAAREQAGKKIANAPVPSAAAVEKARVELEKAKQGKGRAGGDSRGGSAASRRKQRENLFKEFGGADKGYVVCHGCGLKTHHTDDPEQNPDGYAKFERGKIFVKAQGGGYQLPNLLPECFGCNRSRNDLMLRPENAP